MRITYLISAIVLVLATLAASFAYYQPYYPAYATVYNSPSYPATYGTVYSYGYGNGYSMYGPGLFGPYVASGGNTLTWNGPGYAPYTRYADDVSSKGLYSHYAGLYVDGYTGRPVPQYRPYYGGIPTQYYMNPYVVHYE